MQTGPQVAVPRLHRSHQSRQTRRKAIEACERCREKRIKCDGRRPCEGCSKRGYECRFSSNSQSAIDTLAETVTDILDRLHRVETNLELTKRKAPGPSSPQPKSCMTHPVHGKSPVSSVTEFNSQTGCFEYYGGMSHFVLASSLGKRLRQLEDDTVSSNASNKQAQTASSVKSSETDILGLEKLIESYDYIIPLNPPIGRYRRLQKEVAEGHLNSFFATIYVYFPVFEEVNFRTKYTQLGGLFNANALYILHQENQRQQQTLCLLYSILALGALYNNREDDLSWASWYFSEARELLGHLYDAVSLELVQAAMFLGAYAQHTINPNLAYNLVGIATRLAFSIGLNVENVQSPQSFDPEEARRTWWMIYTQEVELSVDSGRPMSIRSCDIGIEYHCNTVSETERERSASQKVIFIEYLSKIARITRTILKLANTATRTNNASVLEYTLIQDLDSSLQQWRESLPEHLWFEDESSDPVITRPSDCSWISRQQSSLQVHFNLARIILHKVWLMEFDSNPSVYGVQSSKAICVSAAGDTVIHIHRLLADNPSLRQWRYYCYYCLQATLVLLITIIEDPFRKDTNETIRTCEMSIKVFDYIELKAAKRCAEVVYRVLERWHYWSKKNFAKEARMFPTGTVETRLNGVADGGLIQLSAREAESRSRGDDQGLLQIPPFDFSEHNATDLNTADDEFWAYLVGSDRHSRPLENWLEILG